MFLLKSKLEELFNTFSKLYLRENYFARQWNIIYIAKISFFTVYKKNVQSNRRLNFIYMRFNDFTVTKKNEKQR